LHKRRTAWEKTLRMVKLGPGKRMGRKKKTRRFRAVEAVKALARERLGTPPPSRTVESKKRKTREKHKSKLEELLDDA